MKITNIIINIVRIPFVLLFLFLVAFVGGVILSGESPKKAFEIVDLPLWPNWDKDEE